MMDINRRMWIMSDVVALSQGVGSRSPHFVLEGHRAGQPISGALIGWPSALWPLLAWMRECLLAEAALIAMPLIADGEAGVLAITMTDTGLVSSLARACDRQTGKVLEDDRLVSEAQARSAAESLRFAELTWSGQTFPALNLCGLPEQQRFAREAEAEWAEQDAVSWERLPRIWNRVAEYEAPHGPRLVCLRAVDGSERARTLAVRFPHIPVESLRIAP